MVCLLLMRVVSLLFCHAQLAAKQKVKITVLNKGVEKQVEWEIFIANEYVELGISDKAKHYISIFFIDCK